MEGQEATCRLSQVAATTPVAGASLEALVEVPVATTPEVLALVGLESLGLATMVVWRQQRQPLVVAVALERSVATALADQARVVLVALVSLVLSAARLSPTVAVGAVRATRLEAPEVLVAGVLVERVARAPQAPRTLAAVAVAAGLAVALVVPASWSFDTQSRKGNKHAFGK